MNIRSNVRSVTFPIVVACLIAIPAVIVGMTSERAIAGKPSPWASQTATPRQTTWKTYTAKQGRFSVLMPGSPKIISTPVTLESGDKTKLWGVVGLESETRTVYISAYMDIPTAIDPKSNLAQESLEQGIQKLAEIQGFDVTARSRFALKGYPGQEIRYRLPNGHTGRSRIFLVNARIYFLAVEIDEGASVQTNVDRFMQSFKLL